MDLVNSNEKVKPRSDHTAIARHPIRLALDSDEGKSVTRYGAPREMKVRRKRRQHISRHSEALIKQV